MLYRKLISVALLLLLFPITVVANETPMQNKQQEARAQNLFYQFKCVVCEGQPLNESNADVAKALRMQIRFSIEEGKTDEEITSKLVDIYGESILLSPPLNPSTYLLWFAPSVLLLLGGVFIFLTLKNNKKRE